MREKAVGPEKNASRMISCPLCRVQKDVLVRAENGYRICKCSLCGLAYVNPQPLIDYGQEDFQYYRGPLAQAEKLKRIQKSVFAEGLTLIAQMDLQPGRLLDVSSGYGNFLLAASERGWDLYGVDVSEATCAYAIDELDFQNVKVGTLHQAGFPEGFFTAVTLWNVLEHVGAPLELLREAWRVLRPGGAVLIRVPNMFLFDLLLPWLPVVQKLRGRSIGYLGGVRPPLHLFGYDPLTLSAMLTEAGFVDVKATLGRMRAHQGRSAAGFGIDLVSRAVSFITRGKRLVEPILLALGRE
jgi:hypothetical protein